MKRLGPAFKMFPPRPLVPPLEHRFTNKRYRTVIACTPFYVASRHRMCEHPGCEQTMLHRWGVICFVLLCKRYFCISSLSAYADCRFYVIWSPPFLRTCTSNSGQGCEHSDVLSWKFTNAPMSPQYTNRKGMPLLVVDAYACGVRCD